MSSSSSSASTVPFIPFVLTEETKINELKPRLIDGMNFSHTLGAISRYSILENRLEQENSNKQAKIEKEVWMPLVKIVDSKGNISSGIHYGNGFVLSTSHSFPSSDSLRDATFIFSNGKSAKVSDNTPFFLIHPIHNSGSTPYPDLLFIELTEFCSAVAATDGSLFDLHSTSVCESNECVEVYHYGLAFNTEKNESKCYLGHSKGFISLSKDPLLSYFMFWHTAPTNFGSSGGLIISEAGSKGKRNIVGMVIGGKEGLPCQNVALHFGYVEESLFRGIKHYCSSLISPISQVFRLSQMQALCDQLSNTPHSKELVQTARKKQDQLKADTFSALYDVVNDLQLPSLSIRTPSGDAFYIEVSTINLMKEHFTSRVLHASYTPFVLNPLKPPDLQLFQERKQHIVGKNAVLKMLKDAVKVKIPNAEHLFDCCVDKDTQVNILSGIHKGGKGGQTRGPDLFDHFVIRPGSSSSRKYHCRVQKNSQNEWKIFQIT